ncbi:hypothetical protein ACXYL9_10305 [Qipengyuania sp. CAU 1752]
MDGLNENKRGCMHWARLVFGGLLGVLVLILILYFATTTPEERAKYEGEPTADGANPNGEAEATGGKERLEEIASENASYKAAITNLILPCDLTQMAVGSALEDFANTDKYKLAKDAQSMRNACRHAWLEIDKIKLPSNSPRKEEKQFEKMVEECKLALYGRKELAEELVPIIDGDLRPSTIVKVQEELSFVTSQNQKCADAFAPLMDEAGI